jgi:hypothetical protein
MFLSPCKTFPLHGRSQQWLLVWLMGPNSQSHHCTALSLAWTLVWSFSNFLSQLNLLDYHGYQWFVLLLLQKKNIQFVTRQILRLVTVLGKNSIFNSDGDGELYGIVELQNCG